MITKRGLCFVLLCILLALTMTGCMVRLVGEYDDTTKEAILKTAKEVDLFYALLLETPENQRPYEQFSKQYLSLETEIRSLVLRNKVRSLNKESTRIAEDILALWIKYKELHKTNNTYTTGNGKLDRKRLSNMFGYMLSAELFKKDTGK